MATILTVEDSVETQVLLKYSLQTHHQIYTCYDLKSARECIRTRHIDLILLDLMLPDGEGMTLFEELCTPQSSLPKIPVIVLSSMNDIKTRVSSLKHGADDYMTKPFDKQELLARIDSVIRRGPTRQTDTQLSIGNITLDLENQSASFVATTGLADLGLTPIEFKLLASLHRNFGTELSREKLKESVWHNTAISIRNVDTHICKLRKKLDETGVDIHNKRGAGYFLSLEKQEDIVRPLSSSHIELPAFGINEPQAKVF